jgi:hypothetical protein
MVVLEAELIRATGTGDHGVGQSCKAGNDGAWIEGAACQFVGFEVQASTGVIACGADEVRDSGWAPVNSAADIAFVI